MLDFDLEKDCNIRFRFMIGVMVSTGKLTYVSLNFHNSVLASYNILSLSSLANQTYFTGQV